MENEDSKDKHLMVIWNQVDIQTVIDLGLEVDYDQNSDSEAIELAHVISRLPYECNPMPSGGMGMGHFRCMSLKDLRDEAESMAHWVKQLTLDNGDTEGVRLGKKIIENNAKLGSSQSSMRYDFPEGTSYKDWKD